MTQDEVKELMNKGFITQVMNPTDVVNNMETEPEPCDYQLPIASNTILGGVKIGTGLMVKNNGEISIGAASSNVYGLVKIGDGLDIDDEGKLTTDIDYIYQQILAKLQNDGYLQ